MTHDDVTGLINEAVFSRELRIAKLEAERDAAKKDTARLEWWFGEDNEPARESVRLWREKEDTMWTVDQWAAAIDAAMEGK